MCYVQRNAQFYLSEDVDVSNTGLKQFLHIVTIPGVFLGGFLTMAVTQFGSTLILSFTAEWLTSEVSCEMRYGHTSLSFPKFLRRFILGYISQSDLIMPL